MQTVPFAQLPQVVRQSPSLIVDFSSPSCGPCRQVPPILEQVEAITGVPAVQVNIDQSPQMTQHFRVTSVPTIVVYRRGQEVHRVFGVPAVGSLIAAVRPHA